MLFDRRFALQYCPVATQVQPDLQLHSEAAARLAVLKKKTAEAIKAMLVAKEHHKFMEAGTLQRKVRAQTQWVADDSRGVALQPSHCKLLSALDAGFAPSLATIPKKFRRVDSSAHGSRPPSDH